MFTTLDKIAAIMTLAMGIFFMSMVYAYAGEGSDPMDEDCDNPLIVHVAPEAR